MIYTSRQRTYRLAMKPSLNEHIDQIKIVMRKYISHLNQFVTSPAWTDHSWFRKLAEALTSQRYKYERESIWMKGDEKEEKSPTKTLQHEYQMLNVYPSLYGSARQCVAVSRKPSDQIG
jgi:hypothetical protein